MVQMTFEMPEGVLAALREDPGSRPRAAFSGGGQMV